MAGQQCNGSNSISDFKIEFLRCVNDPVVTSLVESRLINIFQPEINRRHESGVVSRLVL